MFHFQFSLSLSKKSHLGSGLFCLKIVCMTLSCRQLRLLLSSPIFLTPCLFAAKSTFPFCICVAFVFLPRICIFGWTVAWQEGLYLCLHWELLKAAVLSLDTFSFSEGSICFAQQPQSHQTQRTNIHIQKQIYCLYTNINYTNIQIF